MKLNYILNLSDEQLSRTKIRFNTSTQWNNPVDLYAKNPKILLDWNFWNNKKYEVGNISIGFMDLGNHKYLLITIALVTKVLDLEKNSGVGYEYEELEEYRDLFGRLIINYENKSQQMMRWAMSKDCINQLEISEYLPRQFDGFEFPGYENVYLTFEQLSTVVNGKCDSYRNALRNQKAVYVITDTNTGKLYIGSATSDSGMLLARWSNYASNGHGGNKELKELVEKEGFDYIKYNFTYAIIENYNSMTDDEYILKRESYWKNVLCTRKQGYNAN